MKINTSHLVGAAIALAAVFFSKLDVQSTPAPVPAERQQWEYKILSTKIVSDYDWPKYGTDGWELVTVVIESTGTYKVRAFFKRPKR